MSNETGDYFAQMEEDRMEKESSFEKKKTTIFLNKYDRKNFTGLNYFPIDTAFRLKTRVELIDNGKVQDFPTSAGKVKQYQEYARLSFLLNEKEHTLTVFQSVMLREREGYNGGLFLPFTDLTSGEESYGGGRLH